MLLDFMSFNKEMVYLENLPNSENCEQLKWPIGHQEQWKWPMGHQRFLEDAHRCSRPYYSNFAMHLWRLKNFAIRYAQRRL